MRDPRVDRLAELVAGYALELREGQVIRIDGGACAQPLLLALLRSALLLGANPYLNVPLPGFEEIMLEAASDEQLAYLSRPEWQEVEALDAVVTIWSDENTKALSGSDPVRQSRLLATRRQLLNRRWERISAGELRWCGTLFPTQAHAQDAEMSLEDYERFVFRACHVEDPAESASAHWLSTAAALRARAHRLESVRELRIVGPDTDLTVGVAGRTWVAADGHFNLPDGEVFTSPVETETEGTIRYRFPAIYDGREVEDVRLRFEGGRVVAAEAASGEEYLRSLLDVDAGARVLGEVAFGLNYEIDRFTRNILFDEKIGGTMHLALGSGFADTGGRNRSALHWDLICDLRAEGAVYADGELVWRAGRFLDEPAAVDD
ncbi:MAG: aminopeptidase [Thermoleophilia bacterium]|nr:aminopeptidase [Thermoleophilia bacterium]